MFMADDTRAVRNVVAGIWHEFAEIRRLNRRRDGAIGHEGAECVKIRRRVRTGSARGEICEDIKHDP